MELLYGRRVVAEALAGPRNISKVYVAAGTEREAAVREIQSAATQRDISVVKLPRAQLDRRAPDVVHQGVVAEVAPFEYQNLRGLLDRLEGQNTALIVVLDQVTDGQNLGAVIRTGAAAGADGLIIGKHRSASVTPAVVKASAGLTEQSSIVQANIGEALARMKEAGFWVVGAEGSGETRLWDLDLGGKIVIVLGSEGGGLSRLVRERCDWLASVPLARGVDSLNVSAAAAAFLYEVVRQREMS